jgi:lysine decarboxylase
LTQTGVIHVARSSHAAVDAALIKRHLNLIQSSSPSYPLLQSVESSIDVLESEEGKAKLSHVAQLRVSTEKVLSSFNRFEFLSAQFATDPLHLLVSASGATPDDLYEYCAEQGIFAEAILGKGVLFLFGIGSNEEDAQLLLQALKSFNDQPVNTVFQEPPTFYHPQEQIISPREAFMLPSRVVPTHEAVGKIAAECLAPCPPGIPICVPGQRVHPEVMNLTNVKEIRVVCGPIG